MTTLTVRQILQDQLDIATATMKIHDENAELQTNNIAVQKERDLKIIDDLNTKIASLPQTEGA